MAMTFKEFKKIIESITYKPNSQFAVREMNPGMVWVSLRRDVPDVCEPTRITPLTSSYVMQYYDTCREAVIERTFALCLSLEKHETEEWFKVKGKNWIDPHPGLK